MHTLKALNLAKSYQQNNIIKDVSIEIKSGEIVGLLGPNGAGKTTCFYMILGLISPDQGQILLNNEDISRHPVHLRAQLGINYLPQEASIFRKLSVKDNILAVLELQNTSLSAKLSDLGILLDEFDLGHIQDQYGYALSGGERRRVEIARALASKPKFLFLDEPFAGVDPLSLQDIKTLIQSLSKRGIGCLITDHNVLETLDICDKAYVINQGLIISSGLPQTIVQDPLVQKVYLGKDFRLKED